MSDYLYGVDDNFGSGFTVERVEVAKRSPKQVVLAKSHSVSRYRTHLSWSDVEACGLCDSPAAAVEAAINRAAAGVENAERQLARCHNLHAAIFALRSPPAASGDGRNPAEPSRPPAGGLDGRDGRGVR